MQMQYFHDYTLVSKKFLRELLGREEIDEFVKRAQQKFTLENSIPTKYLSYMEEIYGHRISAKLKKL